ncbi:MAG: Gfo/Idh/MocA family oxidoreductase [Anaerolineae bacterium]|nr:Gfo/Idh/MocA family oxidoreductase [Anaerolineae bacterium]
MNYFQDPIETCQNIAVIGSGYWGKNLVRNLAQIDALACICDANPVALKKQAALYPNVCLETEFERVLADPTIRGVVIATPAAMHYAQVKQAILSGKDVFVEKPLSLHLSEGAELVELASAMGSILMVGHILEYHPALVLLKDIISHGELGRIRYLYSNRLNLGQVRKEENILWSFAPHDISVICSLIGGDPAVVSAMGGSYLQPDIVDVTVTNLAFGDGARAHIFVSWLHPYKEQKLVVIGENKMAVFDDTARDGKLKIYDKGIEWRGGVPVPRQTAETTLFFDDTEPLLLECRHFVECLQTRSRPLTDGENGLRVLRVLEAAQISLESGGMPVPMAEVELRLPTY